jgi:hypothetical protein
MTLVPDAGARRDMVPRGRPAERLGAALMIASRSAARNCAARLNRAWSHSLRRPAAGAGAV